MSGTSMIRVAMDQLGSTEPSTSVAARRFSPVRDANSRRVPVLYAGEDLGWALGETVFHDPAHDAVDPTEVVRADLLTLRSAPTGIAADAVLADLTDTALQAHGYHRDDVVNTAADSYGLTRLWSQYAWESTTSAGVVWNSRRSPDRLSFMLFVNPPRAADRTRALNRRVHIQVVSQPVPLYEGDGLAAVMAAAASRNVTVI
ncbi:MAG TPA: RES family NAD+ phosphorylase, partial [Acidimicrobiales bacterium]|nr:RES family NAD+ phosphorylase [Acidimicrobiales bacterium]